MKRVKPALSFLGGTMDPHQAWLVLRGVKTLGLRVRAAQENAKACARLLASHPAVAWVAYPGTSRAPAGRPHRPADGGPRLPHLLRAQGGHGGRQEAPGEPRDRHPGRLPRGSGDPHPAPRFHDPRGDVQGTPVRPQGSPMAWSACPWVARAPRTSWPTSSRVSTCCYRAPLYSLENSLRMTSSGGGGSLPRNASRFLTVKGFHYLVLLVNLNTTYSSYDGMIRNNPGCSQAGPWQLKGSHNFRIASGGGAGQGGLKRGSWKKAAERARKG